MITTVSRETLSETRKLYDLSREELESYLDQLMWWNEKVNLVSRDVSRETIREHIVHSLIPTVAGILDECEYWVDTGTGGGLPGIPLAIVNRDKHWLLNDVVSKKIAAVKQMIFKLGLKNAKASAGSIENISIPEGAGLITKHAFGTQDLLDMVEGKPWKRIVMYKGAEDAEKEIREAKRSLKYTIYKLEFGDDEPFYEGKGIVVLKK